MVRKVYSTIITIFFVFVISQLCLQPPIATEARMLTDETTTGNTEGKGQSKAGVSGSESKRAGSATNDQSPASAVDVQLSPPIALSKFSYGYANATSVNHPKPATGSANYNN